MARDVYVSSRIPQIIANLEARIDMGLEAGAVIVSRAAKARAPVGDPFIHLRDAIHVDQGEGGYRVIGGDDLAWYGHFVEFGTSHSSPRPFLVPALEESKDEVVEAVATSLRYL